MPKKILKLNDVKKLNNETMKQISGGQATGTYPYVCYDSSGSFDSSINVSGDGVICNSTQSSTIDFGTPGPGHDVMMF
ncbi:hypothetical protein [Tenacibaculum aiptasiae]|uniref:Uncharacterized protein n=1 Tax=Tenacibaculum aiptasiae TaxID=426481 RepID=A0A7J5AQ09_9FLAO|nr:hypothetical protein [Tenacibaculum aiptasiae]KAB1159708.1 hypothetical protein F7018_05205 [Tenacibaculum aiptasiae]